MNNWELIGFIKGSNYRLKVYLELKEGNKTPKEISDNTEIRTNHISRALKELEQNGIIECKTPNLRKGKIYVLTELGQSLLGQIGN